MVHRLPSSIERLQERPIFRGYYQSAIRKNLKVRGVDARLSQLEIARAADGTYRDLEIGLVFLQRAYDLLKVGGTLGIVLPETYFFSPNYRWLFDWLQPRLKPIVVANIPMDAFQGFCRAKTNFYVFEKIEIATEGKS